MISRPAKLIVVSGIVFAALSSGCRSSQPGFAAPQDQTQAQSSGKIVSTFTPADQTNAPLLPDPKMTPGATLPVTKDDICVPGYSKKVRNVPANVKRQVYDEYGIKSHKPGDYEIDHLISLQLGGSNSTKNLWPQSYLTQPWNARVKDALENRMHADVCKGKVDLTTVQREISTDWIAAYKKYFKTNLPRSGSGEGGGRSAGRMPHPLTDDDPLSPATPMEKVATGGSATAASGQVWVNLNSGKYFQPGTKYYGKTKRGQYLSEADAKKQGYVAAHEQ